MFKILFLSAILLSSVCAFQVNTNDKKIDISNFLQNVKDNTECSICTAVAERVKEYLNSEKTVEELYADLLKVCSLFSQELKDQVNNL